MQPKGTRWAGLAVGGSALLHVALLAALGTPGATPPRPERETSLAWVEVPRPPDREPAGPRPAEAPSPLTKAPPRRRPSAPGPSAAARPPPPAPASAAPPESDLPLASASERGAWPAPPPAARPRLTPGAGFIMRLPQARDAEDTRGVTLRNDPAEQPDPQAVREYEAERATRRLSADLATDVARAAQAAGRKPAFFIRLGAALRDASAEATPTVSPASRAAAARDAVGAVLDPTRTRPSDEAVRRVAETASVQSARLGNPALPVDQQQFNLAAAQSMTRVEAIAEGLSRPTLRAVVQLTLDATGALADATVLERSGDGSFDDSALHLSRKVARALPDFDEKGLGVTWWRSRWVFTWGPTRLEVRFLDATPMPAPL
ncbi:MAG: energy transducer TonB [Myxococcaceae bacterium]|nr:energy transducer TonB [Myxococcaceae bacterium]